MFRFTEEYILLVFNIYSIFFRDVGEDCSEEGGREVRDWIMMVVVVS